MIHYQIHHNNRHSREGGNPVDESKTFLNGWIPAFAGMTKLFIVLYMLAPFLFPIPAQASGLGRLFFTPQQRAQLEQERTRNATTVAGSPPVSVLTVNGIVQKYGGVRTVWINDVAQSAGNSDERSPAALPVSVPGKPHPVKMKVGQKLILEQPAPQKPPAPEKQSASED